MSIVILPFLVLAISLVGTSIALALLSMVDDEDAPEAMTGDDYRHSDAAE